jgi:hypothetical protein
MREAPEHHADLFVEAQSAFGEPTLLDVGFVEARWLRIHTGGALHTANDSQLFERQGRTYQIRQTGFGVIGVVVRAHIATKFIE